MFYCTHIGLAFQVYKTEWYFSCTGLVLWREKEDLAVYWENAFLPQIQGTLTALRNNSLFFGCLYQHVCECEQVQSPCFFMLPFAWSFFSFSMGSINFKILWKGAFSFINAPNANTSFYFSCWVDSRHKKFVILFTPGEKGVLPWGNYELKKLCLD